jgi:hypothetical protein
MLDDSRLVIGWASLHVRSCLVGRGIGSCDAAEHNAYPDLGRIQQELYELFVSASVSIEDERPERCRHGSRIKERLSMKKTLGVKHTGCRRLAW